jgi:hypothetical protein
LLPACYRHVLQRKQDFDWCDALRAALSAFQAGHTGPDNIRVDQFVDQSSFQKGDDFMWLKLKEFVCFTA